MPEITYIDDGRDRTDDAINRALKRAVKKADPEILKKRKAKKASSLMANPQFEIVNDERRQDELEVAQDEIREQDRNEGRTIIQKAAEALVDAILTVLRGGPGSGHFEHAGRPGEVGGSQPGEGGGTKTTEGKPYRGGTFTPLSEDEKVTFGRMIDPERGSDPATLIGYESPRGKFPIRDPETGEVGWLEGGRDPVLAHVEDQYRNFGIEVGTAIFEDGTLLTRAVGSANSISFDRDDIEAMESARARGETTIFTHNHPEIDSFPGIEYTLSGIDVASGIRMGFSEIRATNPDGNTYYMKINNFEGANLALDFLMDMRHIAMSELIRERGYDPDSKEFKEVSFMRSEHAKVYAEAAHLAWFEAVEVVGEDVIEYDVEENK